MSGFAAERQAIESRMAANFTAIPIKFENVAFQEIQTAYCAIFVRRGEGHLITLGPAPQLQRWAGIIVVQVFVPEDTGTQTIAGYADSIAAVWNRQEFSAGASGLIRCRVAKVDTNGTRNGWYQMNVTTPYIRDKSV